MIRASAPGRVNLIGEHTDYNAGLALPVPIPLRARAALERDRAGGDRVVVHSREAGRGAYRLGAEAHGGSWLDYVQGCTAALREAGHALGGMELWIESDVPLGGGLASSAALELAVLRAIREAFALRIDDVALALLGQRAEHAIVGAPVGAMDQLAASLGRAGEALWIDFRDLRVRRVALPRVDLVVIASGIAHEHATGGYRARRAECEEAARRLGVASLRELEGAEGPEGDERGAGGEGDGAGCARVAAVAPLAARIAALPPPLDRRVRHVVGENARVRAAAAALARGDLAAIGPLFAASHRSMRDDFEISLPELDRLVALAIAEPAVIGARLTGGGFGGCIVALAVPGAGATVAPRVVARYRAATGRAGRVLLAGAAA